MEDNMESMSEDKAPAYLSVKEMAQLGPVAASAIRAALHNHEMPYIRTGRGPGRGYRVRRAAFLAWLDAQETQGAK
jgi:excisionase family DNA binding protein